MVTKLFAGPTRTGVLVARMPNSWAWFGDGDDLSFPFMYRMPHGAELDGLALASRKTTYRKRA